MKTLIVCDNNGNILFIQSPVEDDYTCNYLIADVPEGLLCALVEGFHTVAPLVFKDCVILIES